MNAAAAMNNDDDAAATSGTHSMNNFVAFVFPRSPPACGWKRCTSRLKHAPMLQAQAYGLAARARALLRRTDARVQITAEQHLLAQRLPDRLAVPAAGLNLALILEPVP